MTGFYMKRNSGLKWVNNSKEKNPKNLNNEVFYKRMPRHWN